MNEMMIHQSISFHKPNTKVSQVPMLEMFTTIEELMGFEV